MSTAAGLQKGIEEPQSCLEQYIPELIRNVPLWEEVQHSVLRSPPKWPTHFDLPVTFLVLVLKL